jgi:uncharacterized protein with HEPN domain
MRLRTAGILYDIHLAAQYILEDTEGETYERFLANRMKRQAVERNLLIIGEAVNRLKRHDPEVAARLSGMPQIVGMRNILAHVYESVDYETVWRTIQVSIPMLLDEAESLLRLVSAEATEPLS